MRLKQSERTTHKNDRELAGLDLDKIRSGHKAMAFRFLLDASSSMAPYANNLRESLDYYIGWLRQNVNPTSMAEIATFNTDVNRGFLLPLLGQGFSPASKYRTGGGTALYDAVGSMVSETSEDGQILVVMSDGEDNMSRRHTAATVREILTVRQAHDGWLCVFLGAFHDALPIARGMGFLEGNILVFPARDIPAAFASLLKGMEKYLTAQPSERKLIARKGIF